MSKQDVFGLSDLANPTYASRNAAVIEQAYLRGDGGSVDAMAEPAHEETQSEIFKRKLSELDAQFETPADESAASPPDADDDFGSATPVDPEPSTSADSYSRAPQSSFARDADAEVSPFRVSTDGLRHTEEEARRDRMTSALSALSIDSNGFLDEDRERDRKLMMIVEIEDLRQLFEEDGEDVSRIIIPTPDASFQEVQSTLKILRRHNDRRRFSTLADEFIMLGATSLETLCDGQREIFGFRPDLRGWPKHVRTKLRRMRHDTSQIANSVLNDFNIGPFTRVLLELVPNLFIYARDHSGAGAQAASAPSRDADFDGAVDRMRSV
jgi:hypothetical protein